MAGIESPAMDVYMQGISYSINKHQVDVELAKILHKPPYATLSTVDGPINFYVYLFKDNRGGKAHSGSGSLTLLKSVAYLFLREYGEQPDKSPPPKVMIIGGRRVKFYVGRSKPRPDVVDRILRFPYANPALAEEREQNTKMFQSQSVMLRTLQFGWLCRDSVFSVEWESPIVGSLQVNEERREFRIAISRPGENLFVAIRYSRINTVFVHSELSSKAPVIFFDLRDPPNFESEPFDVESAQRQRLSYLPISDHKRVAPFTSLAIRLICGHRDDLARFQRLARAANLRNVHETELHVERRGLFAVKVLNEVQSHISKFRWNVAFQVEALLRNISLDGKEILAIMPAIRVMVNSRGRSHTTAFLRHFGTKARYWNFYASETIQTVEQLFAAEQAEYFRLHAKAPSLRPSDDSIFEALHVIITPTCIYLDGPFVKRSNRVIRSFDSKNHDSFLRVSFVDEGNLQYRWDRDVNCVAFTRSRIGEFLIDKGLIIAGRNFNFLAYSQSALKDHAVWFVRPFAVNNTVVTAESIIKNLGTFDGLEFDPKLMYCPARYAARISQAFTATDSTTVKVEEIIYLEDITNWSGEYHFTDGVGTMSLELAEDIWQQLRATRRRRRTNDSPRAYQIRFQGCKGMLSVDYRLKGHVFCLRPSMIKFNAPHSTTVEIAKAFDKPGGYYLNRPLIMLLEGLGVPFEVFKRYQDQAVIEARESTKSLSTFAQMLETHGLGTSYRLPSVLLGLAQLGIDSLPGNKFYRKMLDFAVHHVLRMLKTKARIPIPDGVTVVGVADVHKCLKEGEIFVCTRAVDSKRLKYIEGDVLISRSPTIHPGDVQVARAIGKPPPGSPLAHEPLPNTVVFSVLGERPLPSYLGGGDLDGDTYNIIPLKLSPGFRPTISHDPANYAPAEKKLVDHPSTMRDVAEFVIEYINSDALGMVAINWLLIADQSPRGIFDSDCIKLAGLHSNAVDYVKTGQPVAIQTIPKPKSKLKPDWHAPELNANIADYYKSHRAIGRLFRAIELPDVQSGALPISQRLMIKEGRMKPPRVDGVDDLADTLDEFDFEDDPMVLAIQTRVARFIPPDGRPPDVVEYIAQIFGRYSSELQSICVGHTLSHSRTALLSEEEAVVGTIIAKSSQPRKRTELIASLREKTDLLVRGVKEELMGDDDVSWDECLERAWLSFELAIAEQKSKSFGAQSFVWVTLGMVFEALKELEDEEAKASWNSRRH
ncbi:RNA-directed RNA polymerase 2 [Mycena pura]|uniref:RNA-dependent RNA polymerase n=1 Tax=Mycena pura TaxID=153505 RepID=A0AAD6YPV3_9AGAR|nr:RNA-directed RNA polymerase 2 [Mycena pura]